ncbi:MAG TPA: tRNA glutamyl-Q(34) synthetase GluQRS, partial [Gammaproteobacteria bacterium]|nr:tRNA glutamyl-Q(34) synthetase GluQRS [Gammaproteobacteria bacterium]
VVRGADLLLSTPRQIYLQRVLGLRPLTYMHLPVAVNAAGEKISKQNPAAPLLNETPSCRVLFQVLEFLQQSPPAELRSVSLTELLCWAISHWQPQCMRGLQTRRITQELTLI